MSCPPKFTELLHLWSAGAYLGALRLPPPPIFVLIFSFKNMLNFDHFRKCTPEMYPRAAPFQVSTCTYATGCPQ